MGKAAERRKGRREKYLAGLAAASPERFHAEWNKRMESWLLEAKRRAMALDCDEPMGKLPPAFAVVDAARHALAVSGVSETALETHNSIDMLAHACCREVSSRINHRLYDLNLKFREDVTVKRRKSTREVRR